MRFLLEFAVAMLYVAVFFMLVVVAVAVAAAAGLHIGEWRRRRQDRYDDRLLARAWDDPTLLQGRIPKGRR